jgi:hypothetical protein
MSTLKTRLKQPLTWLHGLIGGVIGGAANAVLASLGIVGAQAVGVEVKTLDYDQVVAIAISGGIIGAFLYLKQSPLPELVEEEEKK